MRENVKLFLQRSLTYPRPTAPCLPGSVLTRAPCLCLFLPFSKAEASNAGSALEMGKPTSRQVKFCLPHCADGFARGNPLQGTQAEQYSGAKPFPAVISTPELSGEETPSHHREFF